uniref:hypothetical protein n=1 Tax=Candidatus Cardinium sp. cByotN1 TaxID=2699439 RepID=UPI001FB1D3BB
MAYEQLKKKYDAIQQCYQSPSRMLQSSSLPFKEKPIAQWNKKEIKEWATYAQSHYQPGVEIELIAGVQHAVKLHYPFSPRPAQLLALLALLHPTYDRGRLAQINTGEGKSLIVAMLAAIHSLQGKQVDVITTSTELSIPEVKEKSAFFKLLNLSVSENSPSNNKVAVYKHQIVYGTASDFQADILRQEFLGENTRGERGYDIVLVDEVDSLLFDNRSHSVRLGSNHPGMDHLKLPLGTIWHYIQWITDHMFEYKGKVYFTAKDSISPDSDITTDKSILPIDDKRTFITSMTTVYLEKLLRNLDPAEKQAYKEHFEKRSEIAQVEQKIKSIKEEGGTAQEDMEHRDKLAEELHKLPWSQGAPILDMPAHLREFARIQLPSWIKHCLSALFDYQEGIHYIVSQDKRIVPVQYNETGVLQHNLVWSDGLCQFLQMKEGLSVDPESISTNLFSNIGFFKRYGNSIYGLTGTLGQAATRSFLEELYGVDFVVIPPYQRIKIQDNSQTSYLCKELRTILVEEKDWCPATLYQLLHHAKQGRAVLAICKSIRHAQYLETQLKAHYNPNKVFTYTGVTTLKDDKVNSGDIILATNIAGRGTDLKTSQEVEDKGGLYVAVTFLPETNRVELQNVGRTARSGKKGMAQLILSNPDGSSLEDLKAARQTKEIKTTQHALQEAKKTWAEDALLEHFCSVTNKYLPSASDCRSIDQAETILPRWQQFLNKNFTESIIDEQFQKSVTQAKKSWYSSFSGDEINSKQLDAALSLKKEAFRLDYRNKLLADFQSAYPMLPSALLSCLQNGEPFRPNRPPLTEKYNWGSFERKAVEERWGIWLKVQHAREEDYSSQDRLSIFQRFDNEFAVQLDKDARADQLIKNPYFYTLKGNKLLANGRDESADICYDRAIALDDIFSLHSHYNKARALLSCKENKGGNQKEAYQALEIAKSRIYTLYRPNLMAFHGLVGHGKARTDTVIAIQHDLDIVSQQEKYIQQALEVLRDAGATRNKKLANVALTNQSLHATFKDPQAAMAHGKAIREAGLKGLSDLFTIKKIPPYPFFSIISMALISLSQIAVGCLLTAYGGVQVGMSLIKNGINDMVTTIKSAFKGSFDWGAWALQKGIEIMIAVASYGVNVAKEAIKGAKTTAESVKNSLLATKQVGKDILSGKSLKDITKDITIETATGKIQKAPQQIVTDTLTTELKKRAMGELINKTSQCLADELWVKQQAKEIRRVVKQELMQAFTTNPLITSALKLDREQQNSAWQQCFLGEAHRILNNMLKSDPANQVFKQIGKGTMYNTVYQDFKVGAKDLRAGAKEVEVTVDIFNTVRKSCSNTSDTIAPLTKKFIEAFTQRIATYKSDIEQSKQASPSIQSPISISDQTTVMAEAPPIDNEGEIAIAKIDDITAFRPPDRSANPIREHLANLGPSTPENLVSELEAYLCGDAIQKINEEISSGVSYGANLVNEQLFKQVSQENQQFLDKLAEKGVERYKEVKQQKIEIAKENLATARQILQEPSKQSQDTSSDKKDNKQPTAKEGACLKQPKDSKKAKSNQKVNKELKKAIQQLKKGEPLTIEHILAIGQIFNLSVNIYDEHGAPICATSDDQSAAIPLCLIRGKNGGKDHVRHLNLTTEQREQYERLDQTKNDCALNGLFVHLPKDIQEQIGSPGGLRQIASDHMSKNPESYNKLFKAQAGLSQLAPLQVPRMGWVHEHFDPDYLDICKKISALEQKLTTNKAITPEEKAKDEQALVQLNISKKTLEEEGN